MQHKSLPQSTDEVKGTIQHCGTIILKWASVSCWKWKYLQHLLLRKDKMQRKWDLLYGILCLKWGTKNYWSFPWIAENTQQPCRKNCWKSSMSGIGKEFKGAHRWESQRKYFLSLLLDGFEFGALRQSMFFKLC